MSTSRRSTLRCGWEVAARWQARAREMPPAREVAAQRLLRDRIVHRPQSGTASRTASKTGRNRMRNTRWASLFAFIRCPGQPVPNSLVASRVASSSRHALEYGSRHRSRRWGTARHPASGRVSGRSARPWVPPPRDFASVDGCRLEVAIKTRALGRSGADSSFARAVVALRTRGVGRRVNRLIAADERQAR